MAGLFVLIYVLLIALLLLYHAYTSSQLPLEFYNRLIQSDFLRYAPFATIAVATWIIIAYYANTKLIDAFTGAKTIARHHHPRLYDQLEALCISVGMPTPKLKIIDTPALNAFASGVKPSQYTITLTRGLLEALEAHEVEAVLAHGLTHIRNDDVKLMIVAVLIAGIISLIAEVLFRFFMNTNRAMHWSSRDTSGSSRRQSSSRDKSGGDAIAAFLIASDDYFCSIVAHADFFFKVVGILLISGYSLKIIRMRNQTIFLHKIRYADLRQLHYTLSDSTPAFPLPMREVGL